MPVRVLVFKNLNGWTTATPISEGRATQNIVLDEKAQPGAALYTELTRLFLANTGRMPASFEHGLISFISTVQVTGIRITAGAPPPQPDLDWARVAGMGGAGVAQGIWGSLESRWALVSKVREPPVVTPES